MKKYIIFAFLISCALLFHLLWWQNNLLLVFCDVGQGDATLVSMGTVQLLVDAGPSDAVLLCLEKNMPFWDKKIEFFVLTHMDSDHIAGAPQVLEYFTVDFLLINPSSKETSDFKLLEQAISRKQKNGTRILHTFLGQEFSLTPQVALKVISPEKAFKNSFSETLLSDKNEVNLTKKDSKISENDLSIALLLQFKEISVILPGDLEGEYELALITRGLPGRLSLLKAGHHGSKTSSDAQFIEVLQPEVAVISSGQNNVYGHPHPQVVENFAQFGTTVYQTKLSGELRFISDGHFFWEQRL